MWSQVIQMGTSRYSLSQMLLQMGRYSNASLRNGDQGTRIIEHKDLGHGTREMSKAARDGS